MKKPFFLSTLAILLSLAMLALSGCAGQSASNTGTGSSSSGTATPAKDDMISAQEATGAFSLTTADGAYTETGNVYTITGAGTYALTGSLDGQILVQAGEEDTVILELSGVTIAYASDSPVKILSADSVEISAKSGTDNVIKDERSAKKTDDESQGEGAIYAKTDLKLKGTGTLVVTGGYNSGVHTTKDLTVQKLSLKSTAVGNALKGGDSVTVKSGTVVAISTTGNGVKTDNTNADASGNTRGDILFTGGAIAIYAAGDGVEAAHNFTMTQDEEGNSPNVSIYTGSYSSYTASSATTTSYKGVKVQNLLTVEAGTLNIQSYDDGLHADYGTSFEAGGKGQGTIQITGGVLTMSVYAPAAKTGTGRMGPGGWGGQQSVAGADAIHADAVLNISGGSITIDSAYEGLEANVINISGGSTVVSASDDGVNACKGNATPQVNVSGGWLDVTVPAGGDTDGIDSNGSYTQTGGVVVTRGPGSEMAAALDADGQITVSGGTLIVLGYGSVRTGGSVKSYSMSLHASGSHTVKIGGESYTFTNASSYSKTAVYSDTTVSA